MAYLNDRNHDVFISYAHADDDPSHWVKRFGLHLEKELGNQLRIQERVKNRVLVKVWKDNQLPSQGKLSERLEREIKDSSLFLVIMSERYLVSEWCEKEGIMFVNSLKDKSDMRIFIVEKEETDRKNWPDFLIVEEGELLSSQFYKEKDVGETETIPMITDQGDANPTAVKKMEKLCSNISNTLYSIKHPPPANISGKNKPVFLAISPEAKVSAYRKELVNILKRWKDVSILPHAKDANMKPIGETLSECLPQCQLFVQILGIEHGPILTDRPNGLVGHQFDEALKSGIKIFHWLIPKLDKESLENDPYKQLIAELKPITEGGTVVEGSLDDFAQEIHDELEITDSVSTPSVPHKYFVEMRYLIDDDEYGHEVGDKIKNFSSDIPIEPLYPTEITKAKDFDQMREMALGTVIMWTKNHKWVVKNWMDLDVDDKKVDRIAVCDPVPKPYDFGEKIRWADSAKRNSDLEEFIKKLKKSTTYT